MIIELFLLPIIVIPEGQFLLFKKIATRWEFIIHLADNFGKSDDPFNFIVGMFGVAMLVLPLTLCIIAILTPMMFITRIH